MYDKTSTLRTVLLYYSRQLSIGVIYILKGKKWSQGDITPVQSTFS